MSHPLVAIPILIPILLICLAFGSMVVRALGVRSQSLLEASVFGTAIGLGAVGYFVLGIGLGGALTPPVLSGLLVILAVASFGVIRVLAPALIYAARERLARKIRGSEIAWLMSISVLGMLPLIAALAPPSVTDWDGLAYHLAVPKLYLAAHRIFYVPFTSHSNFPFLTEMLYTIGLALHGPALAKLFHYAMYLLTAAGIFSLGNRHVNRAAGAVGSLLFMSAPLVVWEAGVAYADISTAMYLLLAVYAVLNWEEQENRGWLAAAGIMAGFALGTKMLALVPIGALCLLVLWSGRRSGWAAGLKSAVYLGGVGLAVGAPWYIKTYLYTGNPVYPFFYGIFGGRNWSQADADLYTAAQQAMGMGRSTLDFLAIPWNVTTNGFKFYDFPAVFGLLGPAFLGLAVVTVLVGRSASAVRKAAFVCAVFVAAWFFLMQNARYIITILPLLSVIAGAGAAYGLRKWVIGRVVTSAFLLLCVGIGVMTGGVLILDSARVALGLESADAYLSRTLQPYQAQMYVNRTAPGDARVLMFDEPRGFYLDRQYMWADPGHHQLIPWKTFRSADDMVRFVREEGYTHALINWNFMRGQESYEHLIFQAIGNGSFLELHSSHLQTESGSPVTVYEVREP